MTELAYKSSGVDVAAAERLVADYAALAKATAGRQVLAGIGGFAGFYALPPGKKRPVLVACTDGVGTKLRLLIDQGLPQIAGKDAAAMCLNDLATTGAEPLFMLDYLAVGRLEPIAAQAVVAGFADYCRQADCALLGGETAEMPGFYPPGDFDVAGFAVGLVEEEGIIDGSRCRPGDVILGLASSGLHSNGFSLVRLLLQERLIALDQDCAGVPLAQAMLRPTCLYLPVVRQLLAVAEVKAMAHITGGGLPGNILRTIPDNLDAVVASGSWPEPPVFSALARAGISRQEMLATFNLGIGYTVIVAPEQAEAVASLCRQGGVDAWPIGCLRSGAGRVRIDG